MKHTLLSIVFLFSTLLLAAQDDNQEKTTKLNEVVNTLKDHISLSGYAQLGYTYDDASSKSNMFDIKRIIFMAQGKITDRWTCYFMYSFANTPKLLEVYTEYKFLPQLTARIGQFKTMYTIENPMSPCFVELIDCYSQSVNYLAGVNGSDPLYDPSGGRDMGLLIYGDLFGKLVNYNLAVMNGQGINLADKNNQKDIVGSLMVNPLDWLSVGGSFVKGKGYALRTSVVNPDIEVGDNYTRNRWSLGAVIKSKSVNLRAEYLAGKDGSVESNGYYATASARVLPKFDVIASYDYFNKNRDTDANKQTNYVVGVQYWFYPLCRLQAQYTYCNRHTGENNNLLQAQLQVRF